MSNFPLQILNIINTHCSIFLTLGFQKKNLYLNLPSYLSRIVIRRFARIRIRIVLANISRIRTRTRTRIVKKNISYCNFGEIRYDAHLY